jgi:hypothetical protein
MEGFIAFLLIGLPLSVALWSGVIYLAICMYKDVTRGW